MQDLHALASKLVSDKVPIPKTKSSTYFAKAKNQSDGMSTAIMHAVHSSRRRLQVDALPRAAEIVKMNSNTIKIGEDLAKEIASSATDFEAKTSSMMAGLDSESKTGANNSGNLDVKLLKFLCAKILKATNRETLLGYVVDVIDTNIEQ